MTPKPTSDPHHPSPKEIAADLHFHRLSVAEVLTIQQCGFPRSYNLNDGMGPDLAGLPLVTSGEIHS
jgi:hypothetical protein